MGRVRRLSADVVEILRNLGFSTLTEIQRRAIPKVLGGRHVIIIAPTGSGKTEAAFLPVVNEITCNRLKPIAALYITPLRALNRDIFRRLKEFASKLNIQVEVRHGDTTQRRRRLIREKPPHVLITTPETLSLILVDKALRTHLRNVRYVIIDEFHDVLSSKRGSHLLADLERLRRVARSFQRIALSASIGDVNLVKEALAPSSVVDEAVLSTVRKANIVVKAPGLYGGKFLDKVDLISSLIRDYGSTIIFTNTRNEAEWLGSKILTKGFNVSVHHGSLSRVEREEVERRLRSGKVSAVIATSSLELGIDVGHVKGVIQVSSPRQAIKLLQRVGRSMHRVGLEARGVIVTDPMVDDILESLVIARRAISGDLEGLTPYLKPLDVLAHVVVGMGLEGASFKDVYETLTRSYPFRDLSEEDLSKVVELLVKLGYVRFNKGLISTTGRGRLYYLRRTMIVDTSRYSVIDAVSRTYLGDLDEEFVATSLSVDSLIVLAGRVWRVLSIDGDAFKVFVEPASEEEAFIPTWLGETIPVEYLVAREVCALRRLIAENRIPNHYLKLVERNTLSYAIDAISKHVKKGYPLPSDKLTLVEVVRRGRPLITIHSCLGTKGNKALSLLLVNTISKLIGSDMLVKTDPYRIFIELPYSVDVNELANMVVQVLRDLTSSSKADLVLSIEDSLKGSPLHGYVAYRVLSRLGIIPKNAPMNIIKTIIRRYAQEEVIRKEIINELVTKYLDVSALLSYLRGIASGRVGVRTIITSTPSPLAEEGAKPPGGGRVRFSALPKSVIAALMKKRLYSREVDLVCMVCKHLWRARIDELPDKVRCPKCGLALIALVPRTLRSTVLSVISKGLSAGRNYRFVLNEDEKEIFEKLLDTAKLTLVYGRKAIIALNAHGVGPASAKRVLNIEDEEEFLYTLYQLERQYLRTRRFWRD